MWVYRTDGTGSDRIWNLLHEALFLFSYPVTPTLLCHCSPKPKHTPVSLACICDLKILHALTVNLTAHTHTGTTPHDVCTSWNCACPHRHTDEHTAPPERSPPHLCDRWFGRWSVSAADDPVELLSNSWFSPAGHSRRTEALSMPGLNVFLI